MCDTVYGRVCVRLCVMWGVGSARLLVCESANSAGKSIAVCVCETVCMAGFVRGCV